MHYHKKKKIKELLSVNFYLRTKEGGTNIVPLLGGGLNLLRKLGGRRRRKVVKAELKESTV